MINVILAVLVFIAGMCNSIMWWFVYDAIHQGTRVSDIDWQKIFGITMIGIMPLVFLIVRVWPS